MLIFVFYQSYFLDPNTSFEKQTAHDLGYDNAMNNTVNANCVVPTILNIF